MNIPLYFKDPHTLSMRELLETYASLNRTSHYFWHFSEGDISFDDKGDRRFLIGFCVQVEKYRDSYVAELEKRTGIDRDPVWYDYGYFYKVNYGDRYYDFNWLKRRLQDSEGANRILEKAGYVARYKSPYVDGYKRDWYFVGLVPPAS